MNTSPSPGESNPTQPNPASQIAPMIDGDVPMVPEEVAFASALGLGVIGDLRGYTPIRKFLTRFGIGYARQHMLLALESEEQRYIAMCNRDGWEHSDIVGRALCESFLPIVVDQPTLLSAINDAYANRNSQAQQVIDSMDGSLILDQIAALTSQEDLLDTEGRAPIIRLVNHLLFDAVKAGASDVHIQPYEDRVVVRQRIDGVLFDSFDVPKSIQEEVLTRIKVLGKMNIAEKRLPQDGRATVQLGDRIVDLRIASLPTSHNERIVIRLLDKSARLYTLNELGMPESTLKIWQQLIRRDHGLILVTGPTGSGKSTTLYGALQEINTTDLNVLTLEDPIEYQLQGISQTQINEKKGMTFASGMRSVLRQDPDIIMVGEIRDQETAEMAIQASLTGHLVFSTLHTNDAASAVTRLLDLGIEPYLVASSLVSALAQRLVRQLCDDCKRPSKTHPGEFEPVGCHRCRETGFRGRLGLFELLVVDDRCRSLVQSHGNAAEIRQAAMEAGMDLLASDGLNKVQRGQTTQAEVLRVTSLGEEV
ncbi:MAG: Flp pilus assembly complex ATPase component TadA [Pirellulaceae bacterium]|nr:Flp pilus assembly complex ATPase component TadA [Pirellulaceae bacterium]